MTITWEKEMCDAVVMNDASLVRSILAREEVRKNGNLGRSEWRWGKAPLHAASYYGRNELVRILVEEYKFDVNSYKADSFGNRMTALHWAAFPTKASMVTLLLELGADPALEGKWDDLLGTAMDFAKEGNASAAVEALLQHRPLSPGETWQILHRKRLF